LAVLERLSSTARRLLCSATSRFISTHVQRAAGDVRCAVYTRRLIIVTSTLHYFPPSFHASAGIVA
jgi:hypothetical protein